jgi:uncharacterized Tic20 family protein
MPLSSGGFGLAILFLVAVPIHLVFVWHEIHRKETANALQAAGFLNELRLGATSFLSVSAVLLLVAVLTAFTVPPAACLIGLSGLLIYELAFVRAGQLPPLS